jgi:hypothetical protein
MYRTSQFYDSSYEVMQPIFIPVRDYRVLYSRKNVRFLEKLVQYIRCIASEILKKIVFIREEIRE